jgi:hypothetical protein
LRDCWLAAALATGRSWAEVSRMLMRETGSVWSVLLFKAGPMPIAKHLIL